MNTNKIKKVVLEHFFIPEVEPAVYDILTEACEGEDIYMLAGEFIEKYSDITGFQEEDMWYYKPAENLISSMEELYFNICTLFE
jgi:hypothetical protein